MIMTRLLFSEDQKKVNVFVLEHGPLLLTGNSHNHEQLSVNTAWYVLGQSTVGKYLQPSDTSPKD